MKPFYDFRPNVFKSFTVEGSKEGEKMHNTLPL